ncbi:hypothetical protein JX265_010185 [Neoarthrinium moseri]|uniref:DUF6594 domain-containing protein n=1 Tax=Neoarthrinium moseri TaxID=1658444 RepID=A0A9P9WEP9_9PEZI|nr:hypothetical protein JX265_010185 [Neoarthrinium moseri]
MDGYAKVAKLMATHGEYAILRRFKALNIQNLLYLQAEITHLETELAELAHRDSRHLDREYHSKDWFSLSRCTSDEDREQWEKFEGLREKLDAFNTALIKQHHLSQLSKPRKYDLDFLRDWFERPGMGSFPLLGLDRKSWESQYENDLVGLVVRTAPDAFSAWFAERLVPALHHLIGESFQKPIPSETVGAGIYNYSEHKLAVALRVIATVVASLLPLCSVIALYMVQSNDLRLGLVVLFSACFSLALATMTNARTIEIFAATAAFAAVNVVFLTNTTGCTPMDTQ